MNSYVRDYRFDNLKGVLIFLVVFGHALELYSGYKTDAVVGSLYSMIYSLHMPVFVFISGYFTKPITDEEKHFKKLIEKTLIPFFVFNFIYWFISSRDVSSFLTPQFALWFLLSLFFWRILIGPVSRIKYSLVLAVAASLYIGITSANKFLSIQRTITFFPFFLAGNLYHHRWEGHLRIPKAIPYIGVLLTVTVPAFLLLFFHISPSIYTMSLPYKDIGYANLVGILLRSIALFLGTCGICWTISLSPNKNTFLCTIGRRSLLIYVLHPIIIRGLRALHLPVFNQPLLIILYALVIAIIACVVFGNRFVERIYDFCIGKICSFIIR